MRNVTIIVIPDEVIPAEVVIDVEPIEIIDVCVVYLIEA
jgi:hypothetical protein